MSSVALCESISFRKHEELFIQDSRIETQRYGENINCEIQESYLLIFEVV
jgi:hypothetical protein